MSTFNKISNFLKHNEDIESELTQKVQLLNFTLLCVIIFSLIFSIIHFFFYDQRNGFVVLSFFLLFTINLIYLKISSNYKISIIIALILIGFLFIYLIFKGVGSNASIIWGLAYPVVLAFLIDYKRSSFLSLLFLFLNILIFYLSIKFDFGSDYSIDIIIRYVSVYFFIFVLIQFYLRIKQQVFNIKEKKHIEILQKLSEKTKFLSNLSYQIRTPLNNIAGIINLQRENLGEEVVEEVELSVSNLIAIVNSIPEAFEKKIIQIKGHKTYFNVNTVIKKSIKLFQTDKYSNLKYSLHLSNKLPSKVYGDRLALIQIIISAIDFCFNNSADDSIKVDIISQERITENKNFIIIKIRSDIKGFSKNDQDDFENQFGIETANLQEIEMIKKLTKSTSGELSIITDESTISFLFTFDFPQGDETKDLVQKTEDKPIQKGYIKESKKIELKDANILLVEDDIMNGKVMTLNLDKHVNKIIIAVNGKEALEKYASTKIDLILMDVRMPLMD